MLIAAVVRAIIGSLNLPGHGRKLFDILQNCGTMK